MCVSRKAGPINDSASLTVDVIVPSLGRARVAVYGLFASFGILLSTWAVHLPGLKQSVGMSTPLMGTTLLVLGVGSIVGMLTVGILVDRFGSEVVAVLGGAAMALVVAVPLAATTLVHALAGALLLGVTAGVADVSMNALAVSVERDFDRPILASFHGMFSVGAVIGSLLSAGGFAIGINIISAAMAVAAACLAIVGVAALELRGRYRSRSVVTVMPPQLGASSVRNHRKHVLVLGTLAFFLLLSEGTAMDWASLHAQEHLGASSSIGALAVASFLVSMMLCRFLIDRVAGSCGPVRVLRVGSLVAAAGILMVIVGTSVPVLICGWIIFGLGLAVGAPQVLTAASNMGGGRSGRDLSRVVGVGYVAILAGPAITGWMIEFVSWTGAFVIPLAAVLACAVGASAVGRRAGVIGGVR